MTFAPTRLDAIDRAFLALDGRPRCHAAATIPPAAGETTPAAIMAAGRMPVGDPVGPERMGREPVLRMATGHERAGQAWAHHERTGHDRPGGATVTREPVVPGSSGGGGLVGRLLDAAPAEWERVALRIEQARRAGSEVIAVTGARRGEGRTTVVACLARLLADRGWTVECCREVPFTLPPAAGDDERRIVLVDPGVWFSAGPIRRAWLMRQSIGCPAVLLVRSADQPECPARGVALESLGMTVLGEVVTRVPAPSVLSDRS